MIPTKSEVVVQGSMPNEGRRMTIAEDAVAHIMAQIIDLYGDPELATLRELSTNAIDSHIMAGVPAPIQVTTPSPLSPYLKIKDTGLGLSVDEVYDMFGGIGASSKRGTNDATGMLGFGSKSPLAYTNQFTMTAIKDGVRAVVSISRDEDGVGRLTVVDTAMTSDPNGVELTVPAKTGNSLEAKAKEFFKFWRSRTVLLNGKDPSGLGPDAMWVTPNIAMLKHDRYASFESVVVMGNVPYPAPTIDLGFSNGYQANTHSIVAYVPIGAVDFAPAREALKDNKKTREALDKISIEFKAAFRAAIQKEIEQAKTAQLALRAWMNWSGLLGNQFKPTWNGQPLPTSIETPSKQAKDQYGYARTELAKRTLLVEKYYSGGRSRRGGARNTATVEAGTALASVFVTGFDLADISLTHRKKMGQWAEAQSNDVQAKRHWVFLDWDPPLLDLIDDEFKVDWATISAIKLPKATVTASGRIPGSYDVVLGGEKNKGPYNNGIVKRGMPGSDLDQTKPIFHIHGNADDAVYRVTPILNHFHKDYAVVCLQENRLAKFRREQPKFIDANDEIKRLAKQLADKMTQDEKKAVGMDRAYRLDNFKVMAKYATEIDDPAIQEAIRIAKVPIKHILRAREQFSNTYSFPVEKFTDPTDGYVLFTHSSFLSHPAHVIRYLNAEFAARNASSGLPV